MDNTAKLELFGLIESLEHTANDLQSRRMEGVSIGVTVLADRHLILSRGLRKIVDDAETRQEIKDKAQPPGLAKAAQALLNSLPPGVVLTVGGKEIDHTEMNVAIAALNTALAQKDDPTPMAIATAARLYMDAVACQVGFDEARERLDAALKLYGR